MLSIPAWPRRAAATLIAAATMAAVVSCGSGTDVSTPTTYCKTDISATDWSSPTAGRITLNGSFYANETIQVSWKDDQGATHSETATAPTDRPSLTIDGLPSGQRRFTFFISCDKGEDQVDIVLTVK